MSALSHPATQRRNLFCRSQRATCDSTLRRCSRLSDGRNVVNLDAMPLICRFLKHSVDAPSLTLPRRPEEGIRDLGHRFLRKIYNIDLTKFTLLINSMLCL